MSHLEELALSLAGSFGGAIALAEVTDDKYRGQDRKNMTIHTARTLTVDEYMTVATKTRTAANEDREKLFLFAMKPYQERTPA